ncbi:MAG: CHASE2 domain-containing protein, partial [Pseudomonadota bacterium]
MRRLLGSSSRPLLFWGTISLVLAVALAIRLSDPAPVTALRLLAFDSFQRIAPVPAPPPHLVRIVDVDERALSEIGRWPWPRRTLAALVEKLQGAGAAVIAFDFIFPNAERVGPCALPAADLKRYGFLAGCAELEAGGGGDQLLAKAIGGGPVVLGVVGRKGDTSAKLPERAGFALLGENPASLVPAFGAATQNLSALQAAAAGFGALNWLPQIDQVVRRVPVIVKISDQLVLSLSAEVVRLVAGADTVAIVSATASGEAGIGGETGLTQVRIGDLDVDVDGTGQVWLPFSRSTPSRYISAADVLADTLDADAVRDRIVLIGTSAAGLFDLQATPLDAAIPGVEVHAQAIERLLTGNTLQRPDYAAGLE